MLFVKSFLKRDLISIGISYAFESPFIDFESISFFDFDKRNWNIEKINRYLIFLQQQLNNKKKITSECKFSKTQEKLLKIGNRIFHQKMSMTSCTSCFKKNLHDRLYKVYKEYNND